jgi:SAM-dependent MidA family methyltransferase
MQIARTCSTAPNSNAPKKEYQLMREWVQDSLYNPEKGYFMQRADIINNRVDKKFDFSVVPSLQGREEYIKEVSKWFREQNTGSGWRTPSEFFGSLYVHSIANYITKKFEQISNKSNTQPLVIYEFGPGRGGCAYHTMSYLKKYHPQLYDRTSYNCVEISPKFAALLQRRFEGKFDGKINVHNIDGLVWNNQIQDECFVIGLELLDNLPHDYVIKKGGVFRQVMVRDVESPRLINPRDLRYEATIETIDEEVTDPIIKEYLSICDNKQYKSVWVPSGSIQLLKMIKERFARPHLLLVDFEHFPNTEDEAQKHKNKPVIHRTHNGRSIEYFTLKSSPKYACDIYYPTNFKDLSNLCQNVLQSPCSIVSNEDFIRMYGLKIDSLTTKSGFNPLLDDYSNTSFLLS